MVLMNLPSTPLALGLILLVSELSLTVGRRSKSDATSKDRNSLRWIWLVNTVSIGLGITAAYRLRGWALPWPKLFGVLSLGLFALGLITRWWAIVYLGRFFTTNVAIATDHQLVDSGPYRWIRHPSYMGSLLILLGFSLSFGNAASVLIIMTPIFMVLLLRMRIEEAALAEALGEPYRNYMQRTKRLIPFIY